MFQQRVRTVTKLYAEVKPTLEIGTRVRSKGALEFPDGCYRTVRNGEIFKVERDRVQVLTRYGVSVWTNISELERI